MDSKRFIIYWQIEAAGYCNGSNQKKDIVFYFFGWYLSVNLNHFSYLTNYFKRKSNKLYQETKATNSKPSVMREWLFQVIVMLCAFLVLIVERIETIIICFLIYTLLWHTFIQKNKCRVRFEVHILLHKENSHQFGIISWTCVFIFRL